MAETLKKISLEEAAGTHSVIVCGSAQAKEVLDKIGLLYENMPDISKIAFSKVETRQDCLEGTLYIPRLDDITGKRFGVFFYINKMHIVFLDDDGFSSRLIERVIRRKTHEGDTSERFLFNYLAEFISRDLPVLVAYENELSALEEEIINGVSHDFQSRIAPIRKKLTILRSYYDELTDLARALEEDENDFFNPKHTKYFGIIYDRADRLMNRAANITELAKETADAYQSSIDTRQNNNMQFLTIVSTIFLPLTLITSWYGMNFQNMPELQNGYPYVIALSITVIVICIIIFKKKHFL
ncbi:MAG: cobalt transporter [Firmicutes bacterium]|nr:cobalt transporter [Bacillota bacterium]